MLVPTPNKRLKLANSIARRRRKQRTLVVLIAILVPLLTLPFFIKPTPPSLPAQIAGLWELSRGESLYSITFDPNGDCIIKVTSDDPAKNRFYYGSYTLHLTKQPVALSIHDIPGLKRPLHTIVKHSGKNELKIQPFAQVWRLRPTSFDAKTTLTLTKNTSSARL